MTGAAWVPIAAAIAAFWAVVWNGWAAYEAPRPWSRLYFVTSAYALFYCGAYLWLVISPGTDRGDWSTSVMPFGISAFLVVWSGPAMISSVARRRDRKRAAGG